MNLEKVEFKTSVLNVPELVTPLKFQDWLQVEARRIQEQCSADCFTIIKLFLPFRIRLAYTHAQLDTLLQAIPNQHPNVHWIDVVLVEHSPNDETLTRINDKEQQCSAALAKAMEDFLQARKGR